MSRTKNQELSSWKVVLLKARRIETTWRGISLSKVDHLTYTEAILMWGMVLYDLSNRYSGLGCRREHIAFVLNCTKVDVGHLASFVSDAISLWRQCSDTDHQTITSYAGFKRQLQKKYPFAGVLLSPIRGAVDAFFNCPSPSSFYPVYQFLSFPSHLTLVDIDMSDQLESEYLEKEKELTALHLPDFLIERMSEVMADWFRDFRIESDDFLPKHGPGGVAELEGDCSLYSKYRLVSPDALIKYVFSKHAGLDADSFAPMPSEVKTSRMSRIVFVPKSMKTKRVISMEPATLQYFQQGVDRNIRKYIARHRYLSQHIDLCDQECQRQAALEASRTRESATVDLSAASDSVAYDLVKRVFAKTALYPFLVALRSKTTVLPSGRVVGLAKFAPMGSALTFPIESLIFACLCECTIRYVHHVTGVLHSRFRVYGDDIIIENACLDDLVSNLRWCGFRINEDKTYGHSHRFRESCGCDAYDGVDVTPMRISRRYSAKRVTPRTPGAFAGLIDLANSAKVYSFPSLRMYLVDRLINGTTFTPVFSGDGRHGVLSDTPDNYRLPRRENRGYQRQEVRAAVVVHYQAEHSPKIIWDFARRRFEDARLLDDYADTIRYFEWLRSTYHRTGDPHDPDSIVHPRIGSAGTFLTRRWINDPSS